MKSIGVDIIETERIEKLLKNHSERFLNRVFTPAEQAYCRGRITSLAARWAAKEAMSKAFGTGIGKMGFTDIEVVNNDLGQPHIVLHGRAKEMAQEMNFEHIALSISHTQTYAVAFVVVD